jgi:DNA-3-methyladenine glycosylase
MKKLPPEFYLHHDVVHLARELLGKVLATHIDGEGITAGIITETEAYAGAVDRASHAYGNRRTPRNETMYRTGGLAYIYLCYGIHHLFNVVTNQAEVPHAVLVRAIHPMEGRQRMLQRLRPGASALPPLNGPGKLTRALGIHTKLNGTPLTGDTIWLADNGITIPKDGILATPRIGVDYAGDHARWPYRFLLKNVTFPD